MQWPTSFLKNHWAYIGKVTCPRNLRSPRPTVSGPHIQIFALAHSIDLETLSLSYLDVSNFYTSSVINSYYMIKDINLRNTCQGCHLQNKKPSCDKAKHKVSFLCKSLHTVRLINLFQAWRLMLLNNPCIILQHTWNKLKFQVQIYCL